MTTDYAAETMPDTESHHIHTVLLATDGTGFTDAALNNAIRLAKRSNGRLIITYFADPNDNALYHGNICHDCTEWQTTGNEVLVRLAEKAREAGVGEVETILEHYQGEQSLGDLAQETGADLIVLASHLFQKI